MKNISYQFILSCVMIFLLITGCNKQVQPPPQTPATETLVVNAGTTITVEIPVTQVELTGTVSASAGVRESGWKKISGPASFDIIQTGTITRAVTLEEGSYEFEFTVISNSGRRASDTVKVNVISTLSRHVISGLTPGITRFTELELPAQVFTDIKWVFCKSSVYCERADDGPSPDIDYDWGGWYYLTLPGNKLSVYGGYSGEKFDLIIYY